MTAHVCCDSADNVVVVALPVVRARTRRLAPWWAVAIVVVLLWCAGGCRGSPVGTRRDKRTLIGDNVQLYLMHFGYLPQSDLETGNLRTDDQLREAIKTLQSFGNVPATGVLDNETLMLLRKPRCGLPDIEPTSGRSKRYALHGRKWDYTNLTWSLRTIYPRNLDPGLVRSQLDRALDVWAQHSKLTFQQVNDDRADILVFFEKGYHGDGYPFDGRGQILAHAFFPGDGRGGDAHFDEEENWLLHETGEEGEGTSLFAVAAHEFGHSLGLSHSSVPGALMYPWYQGLKPNFQLPDDDRHGIQQLYGAKEEKLWGNKVPYNPPYHAPVDHPRTTRPPQQPEHPESPRWPESPDRPRWPEGPERPDRPNIPQWPTRPDRPTRPPRLDLPQYPKRPEQPQRPQRPEQPERPERPKPERPSRPRPTSPPRHNPPRRHPENEIPDTCDTSYDAISVIRREVFIFKGKYIWRIGDSGLYNDYPAETGRLWYGLPKNFTHVDAVYERNDKKIVFFIGKQYYLYNANNLERGYPKPLTHLGLPQSLEKIDAAMVWGHNKKTYFYSGTMYWRFDEDVGKVELDYPRDMIMWKGVGYNIDAVFQWKDGKTYFFKGKGFWKFNDLYMRVENERQTLSAPFWMGCPRQLESPKEVDYPILKSATEDTYVTESAAISVRTKQSVLVLVLTALVNSMCRIYQH